ncbi:nickel insertion protein [Paenibacillus ginsengihumi]|uniref:nickel insertion protein n=1 Tax=Paenibacillus ginsengihumi TaxID=431596 RepID=UPI0003776D94
MMPFDHREEHIDEGMVVIQANMDDMNPETCSYISDLLFERGANDVYWIPIIMKKGRPGIMLNVLAHDTALGVMEEIIFRETTTLGLRYIRASCHRLGREFVEVATPWGGIRVKVGLHRGEAVQFAPEFKECEQAAKTYGVPLKQVYDEVRRAFMEQRQRAADSRERSE